MIVNKNGAVQNKQKGGGVRHSWSNKVMEMYNSVDVNVLWVIARDFKYNEWAREGFEWIKDMTENGRCRLIIEWKKE